MAQQTEQWERRQRVLVVQQGINNPRFREKIVYVFCGENG